MVLLAYKDKRLVHLSVSICQFRMYEGLSTIMTT